MTSHLLHGLVAAGGFSRRMGQDKALISYHSIPQALWTHQLLSTFCQQTFLSCRPNQELGEAKNLPKILDRTLDSGPLEGLLAAHAAHPEAAWLFLACDLPSLTPETLAHLIAHRAPDALATAYLSAHDGMPEPLCAIYEPALLAEASSTQLRSLRKILIQNEARVHLLDLPDPTALDNINHPHEADKWLGLAVPVRRGDILSPQTSPSHIS